MTYLIMEVDNTQTSFELPKDHGSKLDIGRGETNDVVINDPEVAIHHASIVRAINGFYTIISREKSKIIINGQTIPDVKILRNEDQILIGDTSLGYFEFKPSYVLDGSEYLNRSCLFCYREFQVGEKIVFCPKCDTPYHDACWNIIFNQPCLLQHCGYFIERNK